MLLAHEESSSWLEDIVPPFLDSFLAETKTEIKPSQLAQLQRFQTRLVKDWKRLTRITKVVFENHRCQQIFLQSMFLSSIFLVFNFVTRYMTTL